MVFTQSPEIQMTIDKGHACCPLLAFCSALGLCFDYVLMLVLMSLYMSQAWLHSFVLRFVCHYSCSTPTASYSCSSDIPGWLKWCFQSYLHDLDGHIFTVPNRIRNHSAEICTVPVVSFLILIFFVSFSWALIGSKDILLLH